MRTSTVRLVLSLGTVLLLAGCADSSTEESPEPAAPSSPVASESPEPVSEPTPTPTEVSIEDAGARYLELVEPVNALVTPWNQSWEASDWQGLKVQAAPYADALRTFADGLRSSEWPPEAQPAVDTLVSELAAEIVVFLQVSVAEGDDAIATAVSQMPAPSGTAQQLRIILGLDNVPVG